MSKKAAGKVAIVHWPLAKLKADAGNARTHSPEQVRQIAASIKEFGFTNPILAKSDGTIIAGHGRLLAATRLKLDEVPVIVLDWLTDTQAKALLLADNKLAENAGWDEELLAQAMRELDEADFDLALTGFDDDEINALLMDATKGATDPDAVPEMWATPVSRAGDCWILGQHRVLCGDATNPEDVKRVLNGVSPMLMIGDPPYGVSYDASWRDRANFSGSGTRSTGKVKGDDQADWTRAWDLFPGDIAYVWHGELQAPDLARQLQASRFILRNLIVWRRPQFVVSRGNYHRQHETCWYAVRKSATGNWSGDRKQSNVWDITNSAGGDDTQTDHSTQKPVECMRRPMLNNSSPGQAIYDPFLGSGTSVIAAEMERRICHGLEIDPLYVDLIVRRWQDFTGKEARLEQDKRSFAEIVSDRAVTADGAPSQKVKVLKKRKAA